MSENTMTIENSVGYKKLLEAVEKDGHRNDYREKLAWVVDRAKHYAEKTGLDAADILNAWEGRRNYWYMNYYQECNQPKIANETVRVFDTIAKLLKAIGKSGFRCPSCGGVSKNPYECDAGKEMSPGKICDWKAYGLLGTLGKGIAIFVKEKLAIDHIFMPVAWETEKKESEEK